MSDECLQDACLSDGVCKFARGTPQDEEEDEDDEEDTNRNDDEPEEDENEDDGYSE